MPPASVNGVHQGRAGEAVGTIAVFLDAVFHGHRKMLVATQVHGPGSANQLERITAGRLRPAVAIQIRQ